MGTEFRRPWPCGSEAARAAELRSFYLDQPSAAKSSVNGRTLYTEPAMHLTRFAGLVTLVCLGCVFPSGALSGQVAPAPESWAFDDDDQPCRLETSAPEPRSVRVGCYSVEGQLYIHSHRFTNAPRLWGRSWVEEIRENPSVRIKISDRIYLLTAEEITSEESRREILAPRGHDPPPEGMRLFRFSAITP